MEIVFVLVAPAVPENVGASCRALKTMGFTQLRLVATEAHQHKQARILAHGSTDVLGSAGHYDTLAAALDDIDLSIGTTAKDRHQWQEPVAATDLAALIATKASALQRVALVFGCEESGLSNQQLALCDLVSSIDLAVSYPSLNLSQAVMLYAYELRSLAPRLVDDERAKRTDCGQWAALKPKTEQLLQQLGYQPDSKLARWAMAHLVKADVKAVGFMHTLCDKIALRLAAPSKLED